jgi:hypothetical protein
MNLNNFASEETLGLRAELLAHRLLFGPDLVRRDVPFGYEWRIIGAGIHVAFGRPFVFVTTKLLGANEIADARFLPGVVEALYYLGFGPDASLDVLAWGTAEPELQVLTGGVVGGAKRETGGPPVEWDHRINRKEFLWAPLKISGMV